MTKIILALVALVSIVFLVFWGFFAEPNSLRTNKINMVLPGFSRDADIKVGIFSDLHIGVGRGDLKRLEKVVEAINKENPDIIINLGDYHSYTIAKSKTDTKAISKILKKLKARYGVYSILGNHDGLFIHQKVLDGSFKTLDYQKQMVVKIIKDAGIKLLDDSFEVIEIRGNKFILVGLTDKYSAPRTYAQLVLANKAKKAEYNNLDRVMKEIPQNLSVILLNHSPAIFPDVPDNVNLTLSGHTHGGHINLPVIRDLLMPSIYSGRYSKGLYKEENKNLFVTTGVGGLQLRINTPPEVVIMTIKGE